MTGAALAAAVLITWAAAVCQSLTGFGFALVMVPLLSLVWDVKSAVVTSTLLGTVTLLPLVFEARRHVHLAATAALLVGSLVGIPAGLLILELADPEALKIFVGVVVIGASLLYYQVREVKTMRSGAAPAAGVGVVSGVLGGSTAMGGPPAIFYLLGTERSVEVFRGTLLAFFLPNNLIRIGAFAGLGRVTPDVLRLSALALPALFVGLFVGARLRHRVPEETFRLIVLLVLILTSLGVIASASWGLA